MIKKKENKWSDFFQDARSAIGVAVGYVPIGMAYGVLARSVGLSFLENVGMRLMVYAGASQFVAMSVIALARSRSRLLLPYLWSIFSTS